MNFNEQMDIQITAMDHGSSLVYLNACTALVHSYVCLGCVRVCVRGGGDGWG